MLQLTKNQLQQIIAHGKSGKPLEICGLLVGKKVGEDSQVLQVHEVDSLDKSEKTYTLDSLQYLKIDRAARNDGLEIVGIYHTHPATEPYPSPTDMERAHWPESDDLLFPGFSYLIVSLRDVENPEPRSFKIVGKRRPDDIREENIEISA